MRASISDSTKGSINYDISLLLSGRLSSPLLNAITLHYVTSPLPDIWRAINPRLSTLSYIAVAPFSLYLTSKPRANFNGFPLLNLYN